MGDAGYRGPMTARRALLLLLAALVAAGLGYGWQLSLEPAPFEVASPPPPGPLPEGRALSLLAVGDTGQYHPGRLFGEGRSSVARSMSGVHRESPVQALLLLGDNFYPTGLLESELVERVGANLARPYCVFADLSGPRSQELANACALPADQRRPVPILAVFGNHDWKSPESPGLQRDAVPLFLPNWSITRGVADRVELPQGVSLVRVDNSLVKGADAVRAVRDALRDTKGPWRILATHEPLALREAGAATPNSVRLLRQAIAESGVHVQLVVSGHRHNLQLAGLELPRPALQVVAGSGANVRPLRDRPYAQRLFALEAVGFVRVDLLRDGAREGMLISVHSAPRYPFVFWRGVRLVSRWWLEPSGEAYRVASEG